MKLPSVVVYNLLMESDELAEHMDLDHIFTMFIPEDFQKVEEAPLIRICDLDEYRSEWVDNSAIAIDISVQVEIWCGVNDLTRLSEIRTIVDNLLAENHWQQYASTIDRDPELDLVRVARRYRATQYIDLV